MTEESHTDEPTRGKYIVAWFAAGFAATIAISIVDKIIGAATLEKIIASPGFSLMDLTNSSYWFIAPPLEYAVWAIIVISVYSAFPSLRISKVIPWFIGLGGLGLFLTLARTYSAFEGTGFSVPAVFPISMIVSFSVAVFAVRWFFQTKRPERY